MNVLRESRFVKRLRKELPGWVERGWVTAGSQQQILNYAASRRGVAVRYLPLAFSVLGVLLLGSGVITYFAANWDVMPKLVKLMILFGSMWATYGASGYLLEHKSPNLGQSMLLLGVILFGANIMLIAQIYHIDAHYPNGVLMWALGGLLVAYLLNSQAAMIAGIALAVLWTGMETFGFDRLHWPFFILWVSSLPWIYKEKWKPASHVAMIGLLSWSWFALMHICWSTHDWGRAAPFYLIQVYYLAYLGMFILGSVMATYKHLSSFSGLPKRYGAVSALTSLYVLTFPDLHRGLRTWEGDKGAGLWTFLTLVALILVVGLAVWYGARSKVVDRPAYLDWGYGLLALPGLVLLANYFVNDDPLGIMPILINLLFFAGLIWLIYAGFQSDDSFLVNTAFAFFGLGLVSRYFDTFWTLLNRSYFFMVGGVLLLTAGYMLEAQRRRLTGRILARRGEGGRS